MVNKELELLLSMHGETIRDMVIDFNTEENVPLITGLKLNLASGKTIVFTPVPQSVAYIEVSEALDDPQP